MTEQLEEGYRAELGTVHDIDDGAHEVIVDFPHEILDGYRTDWGRGCWDEGLRAQLPAMVVNHNLDNLIGSGQRSENLGDRTRLFGRFADFTQVPKAAETFSLVKDGHYPGWSFHYTEGRTVAHPSVRGARRFVKARMREFGPVVLPAIPGANHVGIRSQEATLDTPTIEEIFALADRKVIDEAGVRALIAEHHPTYADHIKVVTPPARTVEQIVTEALSAVVGEIGNRDMVIRIGSDGTVTTDGAGTGSDTDDDPATLASAVDAALDEAANLLGGTDLTTLPDQVQQALALVQAAGVAVDELLDVMGIDDPDQGGEDLGERAQLSSAEQNDLPDDAFAYIEPGGTKDGSGKTIPRDKRHFPIQDAAHVRNALARIGQGAEFGDKALPKVKAAAKKFGIDTADDKGSGKRSEPDPVADAALDADLARVQDRLARLK